MSYFLSKISKEAQNGQLKGYKSLLVPIIITVNLKFSRESYQYSCEPLYFRHQVSENASEFVKVVYL